MPARVSLPGFKNVRIQRQRAVIRQLPYFIRLDYVTLEPTRQIAEVQWKSGGPGLFLGLQYGIQKFLKSDIGLDMVPDIIQAYATALQEVTGKQSPLVLNIANHKWIAGEHFVATHLKAAGIRYTPVLAGEWKEHLALSSQGMMYHGEPVDLVIGQSFLKSEDVSVHRQIADAAESGKTILEPPTNILLQQKWCMALPYFLTEQDPDLLACRDFVIPTAIIYDGRTLPENIECVAKIIGVPELANVKTVKDLARLPNAVRSRLVLKHAGCGHMSSDSRGVFRLTGSRGYAEKTIETIADNIKATGAPWVIQPYVRQATSVPFCHPGAIDRPESIDSFGRYLLFGYRGVREMMASANPDYRCYAALANFSSHWKVTGSNPSRDSADRSKGSAFTDIRIAPA